MSLLAENNELRSQIISSIRRSCSKLKNQSLLVDSFISEIIDIHLLNPDCPIGIEKVTNSSKQTNDMSDDFIDLIKLCIHYIKNESSPNMALLRMSKSFRQVFTKDGLDDEAVSDIIPCINVFNSDKLVGDKLLKKCPRTTCSTIITDHFLEIQSKLEPLLENIVNTEFTNDKKILASIYNRIVFYIILNAGLGTPDKFGVINETKLALMSVFHFYALKPFLKKNLEGKKAELEQLTNIVIGIRLFYWHHGEGGEGIENIPDALVRGINRSVYDLEKCTDRIGQKIQYYIDSMVNHYTLDYTNMCTAINANRLTRESYYTNDFETKDLKDVNFVKCSINMLSQYKTFLDKLLSVMKYCKTEVNNVIEKFHNTLMDLQKFTKYKNKYIIAEYVPTDIVVTKFTDVASLWKLLWKYLVTVHLMNDIEETLNEIYNETDLPSNKLIDYFMGSSQRLADQYDEPIDQTKIHNSKCKLVEHSLDLTPSLRGYSLIFLCSEGFLMPGNYKIGLIQFKKETYAFCSAEEAYLFCSKPETCLLKLFITIRRNPELIDFLQLKDKINPKLKHKIDPICEEKFITTAMQTELHPFEKYFDNNYHFNADELRQRHWKKTQSYLNCKDKSTKTSELTDSSTQTYSLRNKSTQEMPQKSTGMPRTMKYIYGLRGYDNDRVVQSETYMPLLNIQL